MKEITPFLVIQYISLDFVHRWYFVFDTAPLVGRNHGPPEFCPFLFILNGHRNLFTQASRDGDSVWLGPMFVPHVIHGIRYGMIEARAIADDTFDPEFHASVDRKNILYFSACPCTYLVFGAEQGVFLKLH